MIAIATVIVYQIAMTAEYLLLILVDDNYFDFIVYYISFSSDFVNTIAQIQNLFIIVIIVTIVIVIAIIIIIAIVIITIEATNDAIAFILANLVIANIVKMVAINTSIVVAFFGVIVMKNLEQRDIPLFISSWEFIINTSSIIIAKAYLSIKISFSQITNLYLKVIVTAAFKLFKVVRMQIIEYYYYYQSCQLGSIVFLIFEIQRIALNFQCLREFLGFYREYQNLLIFYGMISLMLKILAIRICSCLQTISSTNFSFSSCYNRYCYCLYLHHEEEDLFDCCYC